MSVINTNCPTDCTTAVKPVAFNYCDAYTNHGEIDKLFIASEEAQPLTNFCDLAEWLSRIDNTTIDVDAIREIHFIGEKPAAEGEMENLGGGYEKPRLANHTLTGRIVEIGDENYNFIRSLQCGGRYRVWWTSGNHLYGGNEGELAKVSARLVTPLEKTENEYFQVTVAWEKIQDPDRCLNPFA